MVVVPYLVRERTESHTIILKSHSIVAANHPHPMLRNIVVHPKDKVEDEEKSELIYRVPCKNCPVHTLGKQAGSTD